MAGFDDLMGGSFDALARRFGLSRAEVEAAASAMMPAFAEAMRRAMADPKAAMDLASAWQKSIVGAWLAPGMAGDHGAAAALFGEPALRDAVAEQAAKASGLSGETMRALLPPLAATFIGNLATAFARGVNPPPPGAAAGAAAAEAMAGSAAAFAEFMKGMARNPPGAAAPVPKGAPEPGQAPDPFALGRDLAERQSRAMQALFDAFQKK
jgi:hypothetical protein